MYFDKNDSNIRMINALSYNHVTIVYEEVSQT